MTESPIALDWSRLDALFFDFDGVLVDSVEVKTQAYGRLFRRFGAEVEAYAVRFHLENGGMDRYRKISRVLGNFHLDQGLVDDLADQFGSMVRDAVVASRALSPASDWLDQARERALPRYIVSATPESELCEIVQRRGLSSCVTAIRGSPALKVDNINSLLRAGDHRRSHCVFIGDACADFQAAQQAGIAFIGITAALVREYIR